MIADRQIFATKMARAYHQQGRYQSWDQLPDWLRKSLIERMRLAIEAMEPGELFAHNRDGNYIFYSLPAILFAVMVIAFLFPLNAARAFSLPQSPPITAQTQTQCQCQRQTGLPFPPRERGYSICAGSRLDGSVLCSPTRPTITTIASATNPKSDQYNIGSATDFDSGTNKYKEKELILAGIVLIVTGISFVLWLLYGVIYLIRYIFNH
jgi:hypothetical protein